MRVQAGGFLPILMAPVHLLGLVSDRPRFVLPLGQRPRSVRARSETGAIYVSDRRLDAPDLRLARAKTCTIKTLLTSCWRRSPDSVRVQAERLFIPGLSPEGLLWWQRPTRARLKL